MDKLLAPLRAFINGGFILFRLCMVKLAPKSREGTEERRDGKRVGSTRPGDYA